MLLHGLTDSPYSLRHIADHYRTRGFAVVAIRLPGHGTVPARLLDVEWPEWTAATRLAVREAVRRAGPDKPLHIVGFSNGGALALKYAMEALDDGGPRQADQLILISPMIGITAFARFAHVAGWPAVFPRWAKAAWIAIMPEFNPVKYNSFPINGALQSHRVTMALQTDLRRHAAAGRLQQLPPVLTFQSVVDLTVSTAAVVNTLHAALPHGRSEIVLFDSPKQQIRPAPARRPRGDTGTAAATATAAVPHDHHRQSQHGASRRRAAGDRGRQHGGVDRRAARPRLPARRLFPLARRTAVPPSGSLYGIRPDPQEEFGVSLGAIATRGERGLLIVSIDALLRMASNPFFPYMLQRIDETIPR